MLAQTSFKIKDEKGTIVLNALVNLTPIGQDGRSESLLQFDTSGIKTKLNPPFRIAITTYGFQKKVDTIWRNNQSIQIQRNYTQITKVVLTGQASEISAENVADRVHIIDHRKINNMGAVNLAEALANEVNITSNEDETLGSSVSLRGIAGQQLKVLIDGVPMIGRNDGIIDLSQINTSNIERVEIIEGPMSIVYGTDAAGGVINIVTTQPTNNEQSLSFNQFAASNGSFNSFVKYARGNKKHQYSLNTTRMIFRGFDEDPNKRNPLWRPKRQLIADGFYQYYFTPHFKQNIRVGYFDELLIARGPAFVNPISAIGLDDYFYTNRMNISAQTQFKWPNKSTRMSLTNAFNTYDRRRRRMVTNLEDLSQEIDNSSDAADTQRFQSFNSRLIGSSLINKNFQIGYGFDVTIENAQSGRIEDNEGVRDYALFYSLKYRSQKWLIEQGLRATYNDQFNVPLIPALHAKYNLNDRWNARFSISRGFRSPSIKERFLYFVDQNHDITGNPDLKPETSNSYIGGISHTLESKNYDLKLDFSFFRTDIFSMIIRASTNADATSFRYANVEEFSSQGLNYNMTYGRKRWNMTAGVGYLGINQRTESDSARSGFLYRLNAQGNITYRFEKLKTSITVFNKFNGPIPNYFLENNTLKLQYSTPFMLTDLSLRRNFVKERISVVATAKNLFNITQIQNISTIGGAHSQATNSANVAMGRYFTINVQVKVFQ